MMILRWRSDGDCDRVVMKLRTVIVVLLVIVVTCATADIVGDECDWFGSGLSSTDSARSVTPVYLRCSQGQVRWVYPRGALRVLLRLGASGRDFRGCVKVDDEFNGARLFLEGPRSLSLLHGNDDVAPKQLARCFQSRHGQVALYVEATRGGGGGADYSKEAAAFTYDLEPMPRDGAGYDPTDECRPCSTAELARAYCTSDLVTRGVIASVENRDELEISRLVVQITKMLRHSTEDNDVDSDVVEEREVTVNVARHCGAKSGAGEYVFMARRKLGDLKLTCAPRLEDWASVRREINKDDGAHCKLET